MKPKKVFQKLTCLFNEERLSDCSFLLGKDKILIFGHKVLIASASEAFEGMLYGPLAPCEGEPIVITDLEPIGFLNILKFIYGREMDYNLNEIYETFKAADKYLLTDLIDELTKFVQDNTNADSIWIIYQEINKINKTDPSFGKNIIERITCNVGMPFQSDGFVRISESALIDILNFEMISIKEFDLLSACARWVNHQAIESGLSSATDKQKIFAPLKNLILFAEISIDDLKSFLEISDLLSYEDIGKLFVNLMFKLSPFELKTKRRTLSLADEKAPIFKFDATTNINGGSPFCFANARKQL